MRNFLVRRLNIKLPDKTIKIATSISEGMHFIKEMKPDWIFLDNNLPDGKGINEITYIKSMTGEKTVKVVMMSAMTNLKEEAFRNGADYFLDKPISFVEVSRIIGSPA